MLIKLVGNDEGRIVWLQIVLVGALWLLCAWLLRDLFMHRATRIAATVVLLAFSLAEPLVGFTLTVLTESLSAVLAVLITALVMRAAANPTRARILWALGVGWVWVALRYTNAYEMVLGGGLLVAGAAVGVVLGRCDAKRALRAGALGVVAAASIVMTYPSMSAGYWTGPFHDLVLFRVLPNTEMREFFVGQGMPQLEELGRYRNLPLFEYNQQDVNRDPQMEPYLDWVNTKGRATYGSWILQHPVWAVRSPFKDLGESVGDKRLGVFTFSRLDHAPDEVLGRVLFPGSKFVLVPGLLALIGLMVTLRRRLDARHWAIAACGVVGIFQIWLAWLGDPNEIARHALSASAHARVAWLMLGIACVEVLLGRRGRRYSTQGPPTVVTTAESLSS